MKKYLFILFVIVSACKQADKTPDIFNFVAAEISGFQNNNNKFVGIHLNQSIQLKFSSPLNINSAKEKIKMGLSQTGEEIPLNFKFSLKDSLVEISPQKELKILSKYVLEIPSDLISSRNTKLNTDTRIVLITQIDESDKFPRITDEALLDKVQSQTFKYFWDFGHPVSGLARERNSSGDIVTSGGSGFGVMAILVGIERKFITREEGLTRLLKITEFLDKKAQKFHGTFPHWLNGVDGKVVPFSPKDDGADLVETSYLMQGLLTARQYFNGNTVDETKLRTNINTLWKGVEWTWFRKNKEENC